MNIRSYNAIKKRLPRKAISIEETNRIVNYTILYELLSLLGAFNMFKKTDFEQGRFGYIEGVIKDICATGADVETYLAAKSKPNDCYVNTRFFEDMSTLTGLNKDYWLGKKRITLGIKVTQNKFLISKLRTLNDKNIKYDNITNYDDYIDNPLGIDSDKLCEALLGRKAVKKQITEQMNEQKKQGYVGTNEVDIIENALLNSMSLKGLLLAYILYLRDTGEINTAAVTSIYKNSKYSFLFKPEPPFRLKYTRVISRTVETMIKNMYELGLLVKFDSDTSYIKWLEKIISKEKMTV